jgi:hypothetical protein
VITEGLCRRRFFWSAAAGLPLLIGNVVFECWFGRWVYGVKAGASLPFDKLRAGRTQKVSDWVIAFEDDGGFAAVGGALPFLKAAFLGHADRGDIVGMNEADGAGIGKAGVAPG